MNNTQHTPGDWFLGDGGHLVLANSSECVAILCDTEGDQFASINTHSVNTVTPEQRRANGLLMAAATEMLAALEYIVEWNPADWSGEKARDMALAAIKKARGEK